MLLGIPLQTAYVTTDLDRACALLGEKYGVTRYLKVPPFEFPLDAGGGIRATMAHAWVGSTWLEIIQPLGGDDAVYADHLPAQGFGLRFHHLAMRVADLESWERTLAEADASGCAEIFRLTSPTVRLGYFDTLADLGHYMEYFFFPDPSQSTMARMPQNIPGFQVNLETVGLR